MAVLEMRSTRYTTDRNQIRGDIGDIRDHIRDQITSDGDIQTTIRERSRGSEYPDLRVTVSRAEGQAGLGMAAGCRRARTGSTAPATRVK